LTGEASPGTRRGPVRPRDAASLILHRRRQGYVEVLMGRRPRSARFMPGVYVFPGGATEPDDRRVRPSSVLTPEVTPLLKVGGSAARARAMAVTAVRETFEETGLMLAAPGDVGLDAHPVWGEWTAAGLAPALACMDLTARAITPTRSAIRFHARFFLADGHAVRGVIGGDGELEDVAWVPLAETESMPLADIQRFLLEHLRRTLQYAPEERRRPVFTHRHGQRHVRYE
jgi:8-oxo-dGTP pyrophosphatase MutT (NUDIX family)